MHPILPYLLLILATAVTSAGVTARIVRHRAGHHRPVHAAGNAPRTETSR